MSGSTRPMFTIFSLNNRYLFVDDQSGSLFPIPQWILPWQPILGENGKYDLHSADWCSETDRKAVPIQKY